VILLNRIVTSSINPSVLEKKLLLAGMKEYIMIHVIMTRDDPKTTTQVIEVQL